MKFSAIMVCKACEIDEYQNIIIYTYISINQEQLSTSSILLIVSIKSWAADLHTLNTQTLKMQKMP